jgi:hypothetical protein
MKSLWWLEVQTVLHLWRVAYSEISVSGSIWNVIFSPDKKKWDERIQKRASRFQPARSHLSGLRLRRHPTSPNVRCRWTFCYLCFSFLLRHVPFVLACECSETCNDKTVWMVRSELDDEYLCRLCSGLGGGARGCVTNPPPSVPAHPSMLSGEVDYRQWEKLWGGPVILLTRDGRVSPLADNAFGLGKPWLYLFRFRCSVMWLIGWQRPPSVALLTHSNGYATVHIHRHLVYFKC